MWSGSARRGRRTARRGTAASRTSCETEAGVWLLRARPAYLVCWQGAALLDTVVRRAEARLGRQVDLRELLQAGRSRCGDYLVETEDSGR